MQDRFTWESLLIIVEEQESWIVIQISTDQTVSEKYKKQIKISTAKIIDKERNLKLSIMIIGLEQFKNFSKHNLLTGLIWYCYNALCIFQKLYFYTYTKGNRILSERHRDNSSEDTSCF